jgi:hypothetical protein
MTDKRVERNAWATWFLKAQKLHVRNSFNSTSNFNTFLVHLIHIAHLIFTTSVTYALGILAWPMLKKSMGYPPSNHLMHEAAAKCATMGARTTDVTARASPPHLLQPSLILHIKTIYFSHCDSTQMLWQRF